jgi:hypothetical protein
MNIVRPAPAVYRQTTLDSIPPGVRFHTPARCQGQTVEESFGTLGRDEADDGSLFRRLTDHSLPVGTPGRTLYFVRAT